MAPVVGWMGLTHVGQDAQQNLPRRTEHQPAITTYPIKAAADAPLRRSMPTVLPPREVTTLAAAAHRQQPRSSCLATIV